ncbi:MAG: 50S ribosomal protein L23 [Gemmatales bacterium]|nr:50S ribosomal protein L23 [Gemmatales bacterium]MCS7160672.1 50S ribosomal protein L23 [Gemmatales bacterium]MDW8175873.1 50S ribosomal protein L23 [Gemmatales bacterium]MDW8223245.1 50S ribosomal protein L23 [Gemmatales bacterium]
MLRLKPGQKREKGPQLEPHQIIIRPLVTEKSLHRAERNHAYSFEVNQYATKPEIKAAVEELFGVRVLKVRTMNRLGKPRRFRGIPGRTSGYKKAVVLLHPEDHINLF